MTASFPFCIVLLLSTASAVAASAPPPAESKPPGGPRFTPRFIIGVAAMATILFFMCVALVFNHWWIRREARAGAKEDYVTPSTSAVYSESPGRAGELYGPSVRETKLERRLGQVL